jgi:predicted dehydrogenase
VKKVKLGIIGCGLAARRLHWPVLKKLKDKLEICVVCNHTEAKAKEFAELIGGVPYETDYRKVLEMPEVDAVDIALPIYLNYSVVSEAAKSGKHIIVEKPIAANLNEARQMVEIEGSCSQVTMVAENYRYRKVYHEAENYINEGRIGEVYAVFWDIFFNRFDSTNPYAKVQWRLDHKHEGAFIADFAVHPVSVLRKIFGDLHVTGAFSKNYPTSVDAPDSLSFQFVTQSHVNGVLNTFLNSSLYHENKLVFLGREGCIIVKNNTLTLKRNDHIVSVKEFGEDDGIQAEFEDFYQAIITGRKVKSSFLEAYCDLKTVINALRVSV